MGDGGDGGEAVDFAAAELPVDWASEVVEAAAAAPDDDFEDLLVTGGSGGGEGVRTQQEQEDDYLAMTWVEPDTTSESR
ncbi:hypothetical protein [Glycomyces niveus]|uniref:Uncharacterized protein n=1 Tax=Glycomyces niveus TaxID=2820287 RepID=A0ABS3TZR5_9ACTN|nr:hypothetical protein [Glycomyces sp. NEAU-S30]MBO3732015.1 hypothetical protein [Glycomyces sp. NEAU-S30]